MIIQKEFTLPPHHAVGEEIDARDFLVYLAELLLLILFRVVGAHHAETGQVFAGHAVQPVGQPLNELELGHDDDE